MKYEKSIWWSVSGSLPHKEQLGVLLRIKMPPVLCEYLPGALRRKAITWTNVDQHLWQYDITWPLFNKQKLQTHFYPRPVLAFGYCRCLRVCVCICVCVCVSVNHEFVRAIIHQPFKLGSPNLDQRCKRTWLRSLLFCGVIDGDLQGQIELESQNLPHFGIVSLSGW